jgi:hypothetical protein
VLAYWQQLADPDGVEHDADANRGARRLHLSQLFGGQWVLDGLLDPISGAIVANGLERIEQELFEDDWAAARARLGDQATGSDLARTAAQRRADALVELVRRAEATPPVDAKNPEPLFTVLVSYETFAGRICELANGIVVTPGSLGPWLDKAVGRAGRLRRSRPRQERRSPSPPLPGRHSSRRRSTRPRVFPP